MIACDKCSAAISEGAKFCPQCGDPVTEEDKAGVPRGSGAQVALAQITFGKSSSPNYVRAVDICKNIPTYTESKEGANIRHEVTLPLTEADLISNLYNLVGSWKSSQMLLDGRASTKKDLTYFGVGCYRSRQKAFEKNKYCFGEHDYELNIWGCKRLNMPMNEWGGGWLEYGSFDKQGIWHFDKARIRHDLELAIKENELCPILNSEHIIETLEKLPDSINPKTDRNWRYRTSLEEVRGDFKEVATGIRPNIRRATGYVLGGYRPTWEPHEEDCNSEPDLTVRVDLPTKDKSRRSRNSSSDLSNGCVVLIILGVIIMLLIIAL